MAVIICRTLIIYFTLLLTLRLLGKRQLGEMELNEFIVAAMIADLATMPLQDIGIPLLNGLVPILVLFCCEVLISGAALKSLRLRSLLFGRPSVLIRQGQIDQQEMTRNRFTLDELMEELRAKGETDLRRIELGVLETNGSLNVILSPADSPVTPSQLGLETQRWGSPVALISDGRVLDENLRRMGRDRRWLKGVLREQGSLQPEQVFLLTLSNGGDIYLAKKEGQP